MIKPPTVKNFIKSMYVCSTHGPSYMLDMRFLTPGRYFFNEELADKSVVIPEKVVRLSTRKRHALRGSEKGEGGKEGGEKKSGEKKEDKKEDKKEPEAETKETSQTKTTSSPARSRGRK